MKEKDLCWLLKSHVRPFETKRVYDYEGMTAYYPGPGAQRLASSPCHAEGVKAKGKEQVRREQGRNAAILVGNKLGGVTCSGFMEKCVEMRYNTNGFE